MSGLVDLALQLISITVVSRKALPEVIKNKAAYGSSVKTALEIKQKPVHSRDITILSVRKTDLNGQLHSASAELQPFLWMVLRCIERSVCSIDWVTAKPADNNYIKEVTGHWTALKQLKRNRISQNDADSYAASEQASSCNLITTSLWKLPRVFTIIKSKKNKPQNKDFFLFNPSARKWWDIMEVGPIKCDVRNQREKNSSES